MASPTVEQAEELINFYICLHYRLMHGQVPKLTHFLKKKAGQLGFGLTTAFNLVRYARKVGMIEQKKYFGIRY